MPPRSRPRTGSATGADTVANKNAFAPKTGWVFGVSRPGGPSRTAWFLFVNTSLPIPSARRRIGSSLAIGLIQILLAGSTLGAVGPASDSAPGSAASSGPGVQAEGEPAIEEAGTPSLASLAWDGSLSLRTWGGYRHNPQLSALNPTSSGFVAAGGDLMIYRLPVEGTEATFYAFLEHVGYVEGGLAPETTAAVSARLKHL